jgi:hypothetical protein
MPDLERELRALAVEWPETPDIAGAVAARLAEAPAAGRRVARARRPGWSLGLAYGAAVLLAALAGTVAISPSARSAILEFLGLKGARIERREPDAPPPPAVREPLGSNLGLGQSVTLARARREAGFRLLVPRAQRLGAPDAVYVDDDFVSGRRVSLVYGERRGIPRSAQTGAALLVTQFRAFVDEAVIQKATGEGAVVTPVREGRDRGYFISGEPHGFAYVGESGQPGFEDQRLAGNTLLLERGDLLLRVEGEVSRAEALAIARSAR